MSTDTYTKQQRLEALRRLPQTAQDAILSMELSEKFTDIMKRHNLRADEAGAVADAVNLVMVGLKPAGWLKQTIASSIKVSPEKLDVLIRDINGEFFAPIRKAMTETPHQSPTESTPAAVTKPQPNTITSASARPTAGVDRTMPRDIMQAKLKDTVHTETQTHIVSPERDAGEAALQQDPYREPLE
jgi:hypothetical protein